MDVSDSYRNLTEGTLGASALAGSGVRFRVWAPFAREVAVEVDGRRHRLEPEDRGYHAGAVDEAGPGSRYGFVLEGGDRTLPDPASRSQPDGVHGLSEVVGAFDPPPSWVPAELRDWVISELHVGTASPDGTLDGLVRYVERLAGIGVNAVELMPLAEFPGDRGWGYDGVFPFAVHHACGGPRALRRFVEACHELAVAVIVDVVDNHVGPEGNVLRGFGPYFTDRYRTPWGDAINFDGPGSDEVRRFFGGNALMWLEEFGVDALRVDAIHGIVDTTARPFLLELAEAVRDLDERDGRPRRLIAESALGDVRTVTPLDGGGIGFDAQWNDEFHHALHALLTGERTGYYADFGRVQDLADAFQRGFVYRGRRSAFHRRRQGSDSSHLPPERFVVFAQNHDQIGNRMRGERMEVPFGRRKVALGLTLLAPGVPLLFQGEEYGETAPFPYFISHTDRELVEDVRRGRREEFASFGWEGEPPDPQALSTFESARLRPTSADGGEHAALLAWTTELLGLRHRIPALRGGVPATAGADEERRLLTVRRQDGGSAAVLVVNFGDRPSDGRPDGFRLVLHSEDERWGGEGTGESLPPGSLALWVRASG